MDSSNPLLCDAFFVIDASKTDNVMVRYTHYGRSRISPVGDWKKMSLRSVRMFVIAN